MVEWSKYDYPGVTDWATCVDGIVSTWCDIGVVLPGSCRSVWWVVWCEVWVSVVSDGAVGALWSSGPDGCPSECGSTDGVLT